MSVRWRATTWPSTCSLETNLTDRLGISLAVRHEDYSDFGTTTSGSLAGRFDFTDTLRPARQRLDRLPRAVAGQQYYSYTSSLYFGAGNSLGLPPGIYNTGLVRSTARSRRCSAASR